KEETNSLEREQALLFRQQEIDLEIHRRVSLEQEQLVSQTRKSLESAFKLKLDAKDKSIDQLEQKVEAAAQTALELQQYRDKETSLVDRESAILSREQEIDAEIERKAQAEFARRHASELKKAMETATVQYSSQIKAAEQELNRFRENETNL